MKTINRKDFIQETKICFKCKWFVDGWVYF